MKRFMLYILFGFSAIIFDIRNIKFGKKIAHETYENYEKKKS